MRRLLDGLYLGAGALAALMVLAIAVLMVGQSVARMLGLPTGAVNDVVSWCCAAAAFLGMAHAFKHGDFVRVTLLLEKCSDPVRHLLETLSLVVGTVATAYLAWWANRFTYESWEFNDVAQGLLPLPMWIPQASFALGSIILALAMADELLLVLRGRRPTYVVAVEQRHAEGDFSSDV
jgi:TRAP-type C4-dicarboxylate transport system permease small subunit